MRFFATIFFSAFSFAIHSQITFQETYGSLSGFEYALSAAPVSTGGYIMAVTADSTPSGTRDLALLKTDANGNELWRVYFGSPGFDIATGVIETNDGGFALCGSWNGFGSDSGVVVKTDASGNAQWTTKIALMPGRTVAQDIVQLTDGSLIVTGFTGNASTPQGFLVKLNSSGNVVWQKTYGGTGKDELMGMAEVNGTGFILAGCTNSYGSGQEDFWLIRTDVNGDTMWTRTFGGIQSEQAYDVCNTQDGGFVVGGFENYPGGDAFLVKVNSSGAQQWLNMYDGGGWDMCYSLVETWDGGFAFAGRRENPDNHMWLVRINSGGTFMWDRTFPRDYLSEGDDIQYTSDGGFLIAGYTLNMTGDPGQAYLVKTESAGYVSVEENLSSASEFTFAQDVPNNTITFMFTDALPGRMIRITDMEGRLVAEIDANDINVSYSVAEFAKGVYVYSMHSSARITRSGKFVR